MQGFTSDVRLVWSNAQRANERGSEVCTIATRLSGQSFAQAMVVLAEAVHSLLREAARGVAPTESPNRNHERRGLPGVALGAAAVIENELGTGVPQRKRGRHHTDMRSL